MAQITIDGRLVNISPYLTQNNGEGYRRILKLWNNRQLKKEQVYQAIAELDDRTIDYVRTNIISGFKEMAKIAGDEVICRGNISKRRMTANDLLTIATNTE